VAVGSVYFVPALLGGVGLLRGAAWGRWLIIALSMLLLLAIPVGTLLGGFGLWALLGRKGAAPAQGSAPTFGSGPASAGAPVISLGPGIMPPPPGAERDRVMGLLAVMGFVGAGFVIALNAGFRAHEQPVPGPLAKACYPAGLVLVAVLVFVVVKRPFAGWGAGLPPLNPIRLRRYRAEMRRQREAFETARALRVATLSADPALRPYAERIAAGEAWSDQQIAYDRDSDALATCRHLAPIEHGMRRAGLDVRLAVPPQARARCRIDEAGLWAAYPPGGLLTYAERYLGGRAAEDDPEAYLMCQACKATIDVAHPELVRDGTPWFPAPPAAAPEMTGG
jgi:hypothetical protein